MKKLILILFVLVAATALTLSGCGSSSTQGTSGDPGTPDDPGTPGDPSIDAPPVRIKFSSLASQAVGPPLSDFEMSFAGRNLPKVGKKLLQDGVTPLANQLVAIDDSRLGPFSNQGGELCAELDRPTEPGKPGLCVTYKELIQLAFQDRFWDVPDQHLAGAPAPCTGTDANGFPTPVGCDPFDGYVLSVANGTANPNDTNQFTQMEANFSLFFGLGVQAYESLTIPDDTAFDRFMDANPLAANAIGQPGEQGVLFPTLIPDLVGGGVTPVPGFGEDELFGFDIFAGGNLTAALPVGSTRNPAGFGSNPFNRTARCMLCHIGPEQTDHSINVAHGLLKGDAEFEFPAPPVVTDPGAPDNCFFDDCQLPAPEPPGPFKVVTGLILAEELEETAQDVVELEPRNMAAVGNGVIPIVAAPSAFAFGDQGIYNIGLRPISEDIGRGGNDPFGWPLSMAALALKNIAGPNFEPCDDPAELAAGLCSGAMADIDPLNPGLTFEETGAGATFPGTNHTLLSINPGWEKTPVLPGLPAYMASWVSDLPAGELHPQIDELGFFPNVITPPNGGPALEFGENMFGSDLHCGVYDPAVFGIGPPNFGWGAFDPVTGDPVLDNVCPNIQSGVPGNFDVVLHGSWPFPNRVGRDGAFKAPSLRNVELTGPYFHSGSYLTLRQVVDFYLRAGDFPLTNAEGRDQHIVDVGQQAFGFGRTTGADLEPYADALPDTAHQYNVMPDTGHPLTPEPAYLTKENAAEALVKFLLSLTDERVKFERAPFDRPELFVPIDGTAPENVSGRDGLAADSRFRHLPAVGAGGNPDPLPAFLEVTNNPNADCVNEISHFCR